MLRYNITPFTCAIDDPNRLKQMQLVKAPLKTKFEGKPEQLRTHIQEFVRRMQNTGLFPEFQIQLSENPRPEEIPDDESNGQTNTPFNGKQTTFWKILQRSNTKLSLKNVSALMIP
jgi:hypothetical protein